MDRIEIEIKLNRDRAWLLERLGAMSEDELTTPRTFSEHDAESRWSFADHFVHTTPPGHSNPYIDGFDPDCWCRGHSTKLQYGTRTPRARARAFFLPT